jgi:hypothetical protein
MRDSRFHRSPIKILSNKSAHDGRAIVLHLRRVGEVGLHVLSDSGRVAGGPVGEIEGDEDFEGAEFLGGLIGVCELGWGVAVYVCVVEGKCVEAD